MEDSDLVVKCSTFGHKDETEVVHVYLCLDGVAVYVDKCQTHDTLFTMKSVTSQQWQLQLGVLRNPLFGSKSYVGKGDTLDLKCSISDIKRSWDKVHVYICKNGVGMKMKVLEKGEDDTIFTMKDVTKEDSGNYSCVYTRDKLIPSHVFSSGKNLVAIQSILIYADIYPARLFVPTFKVREGGHIDFKCSTVSLEQHWDKVNVYLYKNGVGMKMKVLEKGEDDTIFTMKDVTKEDSGNYSCVYTRDKLLPDQVKSTGENLVVIQVYGEEATLLLIDLPRKARWTI
ncbi:unnamed protein product, partial [Coregonus sp. 'balchen']